jgi:hypothetical protein
MPSSVVVVDIPAGTPVEPDLLEPLGSPVMVCHGVSGQPWRYTLGGGCETGVHSHGIVFEIDLELPAHRDVLVAYRRHLGEGIPVRVLVTSDQAERWAAELDGVEVWTAGPFAALRGSVAR